MGALALNGRAQGLDLISARNRHHQVLERLSDVTASVHDAETGQRGYLLTGESKDLEPYLATMLVIENRLESLRLSGDGGNQAIQEFEKAVRVRTAELAETIQLFQQKKLSPAKQIASMSSGRETMDRIRALSMVLQNTEQMALDELSGQFASLQMRQSFLMISIVACAVPVLLIALALLVRNARLSRKRSEDALARAQTEMERARSQAKVKADFLAHMSHEIRTPLNGIIGMVDLLRETPLEERQKHYAKIINECSAHLLSIVNDILDFSKIEAGMVAIEKINFALAPMLSSQVQLLMHSAHNKGLDLSMEFDRDLPAMVSGDPGRIGQVLLNLVGNALKFTERGHVRVKAHVSSSEGEQVTLRVSVQDTGIGLSIKQQKALFQPFAQADASTARKYGGTGLGLSISRKLVDVMGGRIGVRSSPGLGSEFWFTVPLQVVMDQPATAIPGSRRDRSETSTKRILIAEDNPVNQLLARAQLSRLGYRVQAVANGREVLDAIDSSAFDLVLMDCQMPEMDGYEATRLIREREKQTGTRIPVLALTANAMPEDKRKCLDAGMDDYLIKPLREDALEQCLETWLHSS